MNQKHGLLITLACALAFGTFCIDGYGLPRILVASVGLIYGFMALMLKRSRIRQTMLDIPIAWFFAAVVLTTLTSHDLYGSLIGDYAAYFTGMFSIIIYIGAYYLAASSESDPEEIGYYVVRGGAIIAFYALLQYCGLDPFKGVQDLNVTANRAWSTIGNPVYCGAVLAIVLQVAVHKILNDSEDRAANLSLAVVICFGIFATFSRGAWLAAMVGVGVQVLKKWPEFRKRIRSGFIVCGILGVLALSYGRTDLSKADAGRIATWKTAVRIFKNHPIVGFGPSTFGTAYRKYRTMEDVAVYGHGGGQKAAHNQILQVAATMGLVGLVPFLLLIAYILMLCFTRFASPMAFGMVLAAIVCGSLNPIPFPAYIILAVFLGMELKESDIGWGEFMELITPTAALFVLIPMCAFWGRHLAADYHAKRLALPKSMALMPIQIEYRIRFVTELHKRYPKKPSAILQGLSASLETGRLHPNRPEGHHMSGVSYLLLNQAGMALKYLKKAKEMDQYFKPIDKALATIKTPKRGG